MIKKEEKERICKETKEKAEQKLISELQFQPVMITKRPKSIVQGKDKVKREEELI
jgi:hypothetical protein